MKTFSLVYAVCMSLSVCAQSQNGGQSVESASLRLSLNGTTPNYQASIRATNKQNCPVTVRFNHNGSDRFKTIPALGSDTFNINLPECIVKAKPTDNCGAGDMGWVELNVCAALPVKFVSFNAKRIDASTIRLTFVVEEDANIDHYRIKFSEDGLNFREVDLVFPNGIEGKKTYNVDIKTLK